MHILALIGLIVLLWLLAKGFTRAGAILDALGDHIAVRDAHSRRYNVPIPSVRDRPTIRSERETKALREEIDRLTSGE